MRIDEVALAAAPDAPVAPAMRALLTAPDADERAAVGVGAAPVTPNADPSDCWTPVGRDAIQPGVEPA